MDTKMDIRISGENLYKDKAKSELSGEQDVENR